MAEKKKTKETPPSNPVAGGNGGYLKLEYRSPKELSADIGYGRESWDGMRPYDIS